MSLDINNREKLDRVLDRDPNVTIFLRPIAAPAALGLAGFAGSTWITATYIARWWGNESSPTIFFPFVAIWGGLGQFIAGFFGYAARDTLVTVIHVLWGSFWMSIGLLYLLVVCLFGPYEGSWSNNTGNWDFASSPNKRTLSRTRLVDGSSDVLYLVRSKLPNLSSIGVRWGADCFLGRCFLHPGPHSLWNPDHPRDWIHHRLLPFCFWNWCGHRDEGSCLFLDY